MRGAVPWAAWAVLGAVFVSGAAFGQQTPAPVPPAPAGGETPNGDYGGYYTWPEIQTKIAAWRKTYPHLVHQTSLGKTVEGRDIPLLRLSDNAARDEDEPEVLLIAGIHPREQQPQVCLIRLLDELLGGYGKDPRLTRLLNEREIWIVPMFNVDGKIYDMRHGNGKDRGADWRKNRRPNRGGTFGVDLNRNFGVRWGGNRTYSEGWKAATDHSHGNIYEGPFPHSEPETQALARFIRERPLHAFVDIHSPLRTILFPAYLIGPEWVRYSLMARRMRALQRAPYPITQAQPDTEPPPGVRRGDSGLTYTWAYYTQGVYGFNFEIGLPDRYPPPAQIEAEYHANVREPLLYLLEASARLPLATPGKAVYAGGKADAALAPGATVTWTPAIQGPCDYAVLVSEDPAIVVPSEYRLVPLKSGFTVQVAKDARPGAQIPISLYLWDRDRRVSVARFTLRIEEKP